MGNRFNNENVQKLYQEAMTEARNRYRRELKNIIQSYDQHAPTLELIEGQSYFTSTNKIFMRLTGSKADFSEKVTELAILFDEQPDIKVEAYEFMADFKEHRVHVYLQYASDCKVIEEEVTETTTRKVVRPNPECVAAMKKLENVLQ